MKISTRAILEIGKVINGFYFTSEGISIVGENENTMKKKMFGHLHLLYFIKQMTFRWQITCGTLMQSGHQ